MKAGNLRQRANGKWQYRASYGTHPDGRRRERTAVFTAPSLKAAQKHADELRVQWNRDHEAGEAQRGTIRELVEEVARRSRADQTDYRARSIRARIVARFGHLKANQLTARDLDRWYADLLKNGVVREWTTKAGVHKSKRITLTPSTVHHHHREIHAILEQGYKWDMVERNVADKATPPPVRRRDQARHMPTPDALAVLLAASTNQNVRMGVLLAAATGCRAGELVALRWSDLRSYDHEGETVLAAFVAESLSKIPGQPVKRKGTKTDAEKVVPLPPGLYPWLAAHRVWQAERAERMAVRLVEDGPILANLRDDPTGARPYPAAWLSQEWGRLRDRCGMGDLKLHGIRHMHGSLLVDDGVSVTAAAARQGHSTAVFLDRYAHALAGADLSARDAIDGKLAGLFALPQAKEEA